MQALDLLKKPQTDQEKLTEGMRRMTEELPYRVRTEITRGDDGYDVIVDFDVSHYTPGYRGDFYEPPYGPEVEVEFVHAWIDDRRAPELTEEELRAVRAWFESDVGQDNARQVALDNAHDWSV